MLYDIAFVMVGCACGGTTRFLVSSFLAQRFGTSYPYGTALVNVIGCFFIGLISTYFSERTVGMSPYLMLFLTVGFLGGLTTFSSFGYETLSLMRIGNFLAAFTHIAINMLGGFSAAWLGIVLVKVIWN